MSRRQGMIGKDKHRRVSAIEDRTRHGRAAPEALPLCVSLSSLSKCLDRPKSIST
jgi:hypothetical protein